MKTVELQTRGGATQMEQGQMVAGSIAGLIFAAGSMNMLVKAWRTKDLSSYSLGQKVLNNLGNLFYWLYVISLPVGPIWFMHAFFTITSLLMLTWYILYRTEPKTKKQITIELQHVASGMHMPLSN